MPLTTTAEDHSYDLIALRSFSNFASGEARLLLQLVGLLKASGELTQTYNDDELPILVAGLAKHSRLESVKKASKELIALLRSSNNSVSSSAQALASADATTAPPKMVKMYRGLPVSD